MVQNKAEIASKSIYNPELCRKALRASRTFWHPLQKQFWPFQVALESHPALLRKSLRTPALGHHAEQKDNHKYHKDPLFDKGIYWTLTEIELAVGLLAVDDVESVAHTCSDVGHLEVEPLVMVVVVDVRP